MRRIGLTLICMAAAAMLLVDSVDAARRSRRRCRSCGVNNDAAISANDLPHNDAARATAFASANVQTW